ncbi:MAG: SH3 domain-containing protein [Clostridium sp.]|uniref:SH3 domain-containing protein n=1 Tax=Clostridium sp. TaxID=1506 RepID=UPI003F3FC818
MNKTKVKSIIAVGCIIGALITIKPMESYGQSLHHTQATVKEKTSDIGKENTKIEKEKASVELRQINIFTGQEVKTTQKQRTQEFSIIFNGDNHSSYFNDKNLGPKMRQTDFHSKTQEKLYNYLMNPDNRWAAEDQAVGAHGGILENNCVFFVSSALRNIGIKIPMDIGYTTNLERELTSLGWEKETNLSTLEAGDICFAGQAHTYVFMGWANKAAGVAWVADNQYSWYGSNFHPRDKHEVPANDTSKTTCYYRLPGNVDIGGPDNVPDMPENYNYTIGTSNGSVNVRKSPTTDSSIVGTLTYGERVKIVGQTGDWFKIRYNKQYAYVYAPLINGQAPKFSSPYENVTDLNQKGYIDFDGGNYTSSQDGPTWYNKSVADIYNGTAVKITGEANGWYRLNYYTSNGNLSQKSAWVPKYRVSILNNEIEGMGTVNGTSGNYTYARTGPSWAGTSTVGSINKGVTVNILGESHGWYKVAFDGKEAWVPGNRLDTSLNKNEKPISSGVINNGTVGYTSIQGGPSWSDDCIGSLNNGTKVEVVSSYNGWTEINYKNATGWLPSDRLQGSSVVGIGTGTVDFQNGPYTYVVDQNSWNGNVLGSINNGTKVTILAKKAGWYKIEYKNGTGWVLGNRINTSLNCNQKVLSEGYINNGSVGYTYVQSGPAWNDDNMGSLNNGTKVEVVSSYNGWTEINYKDSTAWLPSDRVSKSQLVGIGTGTVAFQNGAYTYVVDQNSWNGNVLGSINNGTKVTILAKKAGWYKIEYKNGTGWVLGNRINTSLNCNQKVLSEGYINNGSVGYTYVQSGPAWNDDNMGSLNNGTKVEVVSSYNGWTEINYKNSTAWLPSERVSKIQLMGTGTIDFKNGSYTYVVDQNSWSGNVLGSINNGTKVNILAKKAGWYKIEYKNGTAWVLGNRINTSLNCNQKTIRTGKIDNGSVGYTYVQSGPAWNDDYMGSLNNGTKVEVVSTYNGWTEINYKNSTAWLPSDRVK